MQGRDLKAVSCLFTFINRVSPIYGLCAYVKRSNDMTMKKLNWCIRGELIRYQPVRRWMADSFRVSWYGLGGKRDSEEKCLLKQCHWREVLTQFWRGPFLTNFSTPGFGLSWARGSDSLGRGEKLLFVEWTNSQWFHFYPLSECCGRKPKGW